MNKTYVKRKCTREQMDKKLRDFKIAELLCDDLTELKEWINTHYVPIKRDDNTFLKFSGVHINNPMKTIIINVI